MRTAQNAKRSTPHVTRSRSPRLGHADRRIFMRRLGRRTFAGLIASALLIGCSAATTEPLHGDVDRARQAWLAGSATSYSFELATASSWFPKGGYVFVEVNDGRVVATVAPAGEPSPAGVPPTIDEIWNRILDARERGQLNSAQFDRQGVPVESDMGPWPVDGGVHYSVRAFTKTR
jgi:hypothetical protein